MYLCSKCNVQKYTLHEIIHHYNNCSMKHGYLKFTSINTSSNNSHSDINNSKSTTLVCPKPKHKKKICNYLQDCLHITKVKYQGFYI